MAGTDLKSKYLGGMVGSALGDAIGEIAFRNPEKRGLLAAIERTEKLIYTDDTAMAMGLAGFILQKRNIGLVLSRNRIGHLF